MKDINQKRGPTVGNAGNSSKRQEFLAAKKSSGSERSQLADMVTGALEQRGRQSRSARNPAVEGISPNTRVPRGPTRGLKN